MNRVRVTGFPWNAQDGTDGVTMLRLFPTAALLVSFWALLAPAPAHANHCLAYVQGTPGIVPVALSTDQAADAVRITYVDFPAPA